MSLSLSTSVPCCAAQVMLIRLPTLALAPCRAVLATNPPLRTFWWNLDTDRTQRISDRAGYRADIAHDLLATFTKDPYLGGCSVLSRLSDPGTTLWRSCDQAIAGFSPSGTRVTTVYLLSDGLGLFYDLVFATLCVGLALAVRPSDFFPVGVFPPLAMFGVVLILAVSQPETVADPTDGVVQATVSGLSGHAVALALGYAACLAVLVVRRQVRSGRGRPRRAG